MTTATAVSVSPTSGRGLRIAFWVAQILLAVAFCLIGFTKLTGSIADLTAMMKWPGDYSSTFVRFIGLVDLLGGIGILLPSATRVLPRLSVLAALGLVVLQVLAMGFHLSRGEANMLPVNVVFLALSLFVLWGRSRKAPIAAR
jgi:uncharacterized membrane protein YphA (DoxX/SURF4 family)